MSPESSQLRRLDGCVDELNSLSEHRLEDQKKRSRILKQQENLGYQSCLGDRQGLGPFQHFGINLGNIKRQFTEQILTHLESKLSGIISPVELPISNTWTMKCFVIFQYFLTVMIYTVSPPHANFRRCRRVFACHID